MRKPVRFLMGLVAALAITAGCNTDFGDTNVVDSGNINTNDVSVSADAGRVCTNTCRPGFINTAECVCVSQCMPGCSPAQTCQIDARTGAWDCVTIPVDAGTPPVDVQTPPVDSGSCNSGDDCSSQCQNPARPRGRIICGEFRGCLCEPALPTDAGTLPVDVAPSCNISGQTLCGTTCVDLRSDSANCGGCGTQCGAGNRCDSGRCVVDCSAGTTECSGVCIDTRVSVANCGACDRACPVRANTGVTCTASACRYTCTTGFAAGDGNPANGCTVNLQNDPRNCGGVGTVCTVGMNASPSCTNGFCRAACSPGYFDADGLIANGCEVNLQTDARHCGTPNRVCAGATSTCCSGDCVDVRNDGLHCGGCGMGCSNGQGCSNATCTGTCRPGQSICRVGTVDACVDTQSSSDHCGTCGNTCSVTNGYAVCTSGRCGFGACWQGYANCDSNVANGCETNVNNDVRNCRACGTVCASAPNGTPYCAFDGCAIACTAGFRNCDGSNANGCEVNLNSDRMNCGGCGITCASNERCNAGWCQTDCVAPQIACGSRCINPQTDIANCGACGNACGTGVSLTTSCQASACRYTCAAGFADCDGNRWTGCEVNVTTVANCGGCGVRCATGASCTTGACTCPSGQTVCNNACVSLQTDATNCGGCGRTCPSGQSCSAGVCSGPVVIDAGTSDSGPADTGVDAGFDTGTDVGNDIGSIDAGTPDAGTGVDAGTDVPDSGVIPFVCPAGTHPRSIVFRLSSEIPEGCPAPLAPETRRLGRPVLWGQSVIDRQRILVESDVTIQMVGDPPITPEFSVLFPAIGSPLTTLPMRILNSSFWPRGVVFYGSARCNDQRGTYYESLAHWSRFTDLRQAGGVLLVDGVDMSDQFRSDGRVLSFVMTDPCLPN